MLTQKDFRLLEKEAINLYGDLEIEIIEEIAERIANVGYANTVVYNNAVILQEMGMLYEDIINMVAKYNEKTNEEILKIFENAGIKSLKRDDSIYKLAGLNPKGLNISMQQLLASTARKTHNNLSRLTQTTASTSQIQFLNAMNKCYMEVSTGVKSYSQSIVDTVKDISKNGAYVEYPSGARRSIEVATRMNILTGVNQTSGQLQLMRAEEMNWDLMELSAHGGARPEHAEWQGKIVSRSGQAGYLSLDDIGYGTVTGFQGVNCRHTWFPYYKGSTMTYTSQELNELKNAKVEYNGKQISEYEASQIQRGMERRIRQDKKDIAGLQGILTSDTKDSKLIEETKIKLRNAQVKLKQNNSILNEFVKQTGLKKDSTRLAIGKAEKNKSTIINYLKIPKDNVEKEKLMQNIMIDINESRANKWNLNLIRKKDLDSKLKELSFSVDFKGIDDKIVDTIIENYDKLGKKYYSTLNHIGVFDADDLITRPTAGGYTIVHSRTLTGEIYFNQNDMKKYDSFVELMKNASSTGHIPKTIDEKNLKYYVSTHEFAHSIFTEAMLEKNLIGMDTSIYKNFDKELETLYNNYKTKISSLDNEIKELNTKFVLDTENFSKEDSIKLKNLKSEYDNTFVSKYAIRDGLKEEFMAECFAQANLSSNPSKTSMDVLKIIDKYFRK